MDESLGSAMERLEDPPLITGQVEYTDDIDVEDAAYVSFVGSMYGHARIEDIDTTRAEDHPSTVAVYTAEDVTESGIPGTIPGQSSMTQFDRPEAASRVLRELVTPERPLLARDRVRYQGEPIAVVVAEDRYAASTVADLVDVDYDRLDAAATPAAAMADGAPTIHEGAPDNIAYETEIGDETAVDRAFEAADHSVEVTIGHQRINPTPIEPRAMIAVHDGDRLDLTMTTQVPHYHRSVVADVLGMNESTIRVHAPDVGGAFGSKMNDYPREVTVAWIATILDRPVKWQAERTESLLSDGHGRCHETEAKLAFDDDGQFLALRARTTGNIGSYVSARGPRVMTTPFTAMLSGQYEIPVIYARLKGTFTNTAPIGPYRGTSRTRAILTLERLVHLAARDLDVDPAELRRRNFIPADEFPYEAPVGTFYDSGDYHRALEKALSAVDYEALREEQARARTEGRYVGIGIGCGIDEGGSSTGESGRVRIQSDGTVTAYCGTADQGQGHETTFKQIVAAQLDLPIEEIDFIEGDTDAVEEGTGTFGSRSVFQGGTALHNSAVKVIEQAREVAAEALEVSTADLEYEAGAFQIAGVPDRSLTIQEVAGMADSGSLTASEWYEPTNVTLPSMAHVAVVEVDPRSGEIDFHRYVAIDDVGTQINPQIVEGQVHGGVAQGIGQALLESVEYDDNANMSTAALANYAMPKSGNIPSIEVGSIESPSPVTPLGVKGVGESGTIAAPPAIANAVVDALEPFGVRHLDLPLTPERIWEATRSDQS